MKTDVLMIRISPELKQQLREAAEKRGQTISEFVLDLVKKELWTAGD